MSKSVKVVPGSGGWGGPLIISADEKKHLVLSVTSGGICEVAKKLGEMLECDVVDAWKGNYPDEEVAVAVVDCGGTARCGVYPKKGIYTLNLNAVGKVGPLADFITEDIYCSAVGVAQLSFADGSEAPASASEPKTMQNAKTKEQARKELAEANDGKKPNVIASIGIAVGKVVNKFFDAGRQTIDAVIRNILPFMAFTATIIGFISVSGLGDVIANTITPFVSTLPGMLLISIVCAIPFLSPILGPGAVIAQVVGTLLGTQFAIGAIPPQYALPALFAIDAQVGCDFIPVGLSLGEAESETIEYGVPAVLFSRLITGPVSVLIAFAFSLGLYA